MRDHPLLPPTHDSPVLHQFLHDFRIDADRPPDQILLASAQAFADLPYENLTKIIKDAETGTVEAARRTPAEVLADHTAFGTGGTCFALTSALLHLVRALGFPAEPILADRRYGADTHSALLVWIDGEPHLLDPGYMIVQPLALPREGELRIPTSFNEVILTARDGGAKVDLATRQDGRATHRLTFKTNPVDAGEFLRAWDNSFKFDMMAYPVLSRIVAGKQLYFQKRHFMVRASDETTRQEIAPDQLVAELSQRFGIAPTLVRKALSILKKKGSPHAIDA